MLAIPSAFVIYEPGQEKKWMPSSHPGIKAVATSSVYMYDGRATGCSERTQIGTTFVQFTIDSQPQNGQRSILNTSKMVRISDLFPFPIINIHPLAIAYFFLIRGHHKRLDCRYICNNSTFCLGILLLFETSQTSGRRPVLQSKRRFPPS